MIWFTADTHFGHRNVIEYSRRPFQHVEAMEAFLVAWWNEVVQPNDDVWHLGDFSLSGRVAERVRPLLNGRIHLVLGNHDDERVARRIFDSVQEVKYLRHEGHRFYLSHYAHRVWRNSDNGSFHLFGHSHGDLPSWGRSMDAGVDANNYRPVSLADVVVRLSGGEPTAHHVARTLASRDAEEGR